MRGKRPMSGSCGQSDRARAPYPCGIEVSPRAGWMLVQHTLRRDMLEGGHRRQTMRVFVMVLLALGTVNDSDQKREPRMVALRHFEDISNEETAQVLGIKPSAASTRHVRALKRLREVLQRSPGFFDKNRE